MNGRGRVLLVTAICGASCGGEPERSASAGWWEGTPLQQARAVLERSTTRRGLVAVVGDGAGGLALEIARDSDLLVQVQLTRADETREVRRRAEAEGLLGGRLSVQRGPLTRLHLADDLANLVVVPPGVDDVDEAEALRIVQPGGTLLFGERELHKPLAQGADDWSHPYHGPDNNPQSDDRLARAPYLTQFLADPRYAPVPQVAVSAGGRVFKAFGNVAFKPREEPLLNRLVAFDAYNGAMLWIRDLAPGFMIHRNTFVATPEVLYLADDTSCKLIDAATGRLRGELRPPTSVAGGTFWKWMALEDGVLYALIGEDEPRDPVQRHGREAHGWPWDRISEGYNAPENPWGFGRNLLAIDVESQAVLWSHREQEPVDSRAVCMKAGRIHLFRPGAYLVSLDANSGQVVWRKQAPTPPPAPEGRDPSTLSLRLESVDPATGAVVVNGLDSAAPEVPFTWSWGDGSSEEGFFPSQHTYRDRSRAYVVTVTAHYPDGGTATQEVRVCFTESRAYAREEAPELFEALGPSLGRQGWATNWRTTAYLKCGEDVLYFAGPQVGKLLAVAVEDGRVLWEHPYDNFQLVLREEGLYGISGPFGAAPSRLFDPLTGEVLADLEVGRRACSRPTGTPDALLFRARGGSVRLDVESGEPQWISPMRAQCQDGVTVAAGHLYWWPSVCDCNLQLYGVTCLGPAGDHDFAAPVVAAERLEVGEGPAEVAALETSPADWPTFRANNRCTATSGAQVAVESSLLWSYQPPARMRPTAPVAAGGLVFLGGSDGVVRALDAVSGELRWSAATGGAIRIPPSIAEDRALVGSGDGWAYCFEALTGRLLWRFRAAPLERQIPVYGQLLSTWPVASGVLVEDGVAYLAAGIVNYDGTHVYALDAESGELLWHNGSSGHLDPVARTGVSVQGHLLLRGDRLHLAGGTAVSPATFDTADGRCLDSPDQLSQLEARGSRGWELYQIGDEVVACGRPFYADPRYPVVDSDVTSKLFVGAVGDRDVVLVDDRHLACYPRIDRAHLSACVADRSAQSWFSYNWGRFDATGLEADWQRTFDPAAAVAVAANAVVLATEERVEAFDLQDGTDLWGLDLPAAPVRWGLALDRAGRSVVALVDGRVVCIGGEGVGGRER